MSRRHFLRVSALAAGAAVVPSWLLAQPACRSLSFVHTHTGERLAVEYWADGRYEPEALREIDHLLRDFPTGDAHPIDRGLLDVLADLRTGLGTRQPFQVISGYRSPATNAALRAAGHGVATHSLHIQGQAIDVRIPGVRLADLRRAAIDERRGGVGYYPDSDFVHVDTGRIRYW